MSTGFAGAGSPRKTRELHPEADKQTADNWESMHILEPLDQVPTIQETVYKKILEAIVSGQIAPGERLLIEKTAKQLNVSRMPVREALHRLQAAGLISSDRKNVIRVNKLSREDLKEITAIRLLLETAAAERTAVLCSEDTVRRLETIQQQYLAAKSRNNVEHFLDCNKEFHHTIYREANMPILQQMIDGLWHRISPYFHLLMRGVDISNTQEFEQYHNEMLDGMRRRDPKKVSKWLGIEITEGERLINVIIDSQGKR
jgi:DNA-binding GntR family transcriptional regulator